MKYSQVFAYYGFVILESLTAEMSVKIKYFAVAREARMHILSVCSHGY